MNLQASNNNRFVHVKSKLESKWNQIAKYGKWNNFRISFAIRISLISTHIVSHNKSFVRNHWISNHFLPLVVLVHIVRTTIINLSRICRFLKLCTFFTWIFCLLISIILFPNSKMKALPLTSVQNNLQILFDFIFCSFPS